MPRESTSLLRDEERDEEPTNHEPTPLPWHSLSVLLLLTMIQPLAFEIIFPFVNQMILEIGVVTDPEQVGFYSGLVESIFACMSFLAIMPSGYLADQIGRKPVILGGITGLAVSSASFGMSKSFLAMVFSRCLGGALGGTWTCARLMVAEMSDKSNRASAFQWWGIAYRAGQIIGLPLGGLLVHPARNFKLFQTPFWNVYPFALPCFVASALAFCSVFLGYFNLKETLSSKISISEPTYGTISLPADAAPTATPSACNGVPLPTDYLPQRVEKPSMRSILTPSIISLLASNFAMCLASETLFCVFPLFAFTPISSGGLGLSEAAIGTQMAVRAVLHIALMSLYTRLQRHFGSTTRMYRMVMWMWPVTVLCAPLLNCIARRDGGSSWPFNLAMFFFFIIWALGGFAWTSLCIMVTDAAPSAGALADINGLSQMAAVISQAIAPASITSLFAISINSGLAGGNLIWIVLFAFTCAAALHSMTLREPTSDWREIN